MTFSRRKTVHEGFSDFNPHFFLGINAYVQELPGCDHESELLEFSQKLYLDKCLIFAGWVEIRNPT